MDFYGSQSDIQLKCIGKILAKMLQNTENLNFNLPSYEKITLKT
jgi:hypothetical protein